MHQGSLEQLVKPGCLAFLEWMWVFCHLLLDLLNISRKCGCFPEVCHQLSLCLLEKQTRSWIYIYVLCIWRYFKSWKHPLIELRTIRTILRCVADRTALLQWNMAVLQRCAGQVCRNTGSSWHFWSKPVERQFRNPVTLPSWGLLVTGLGFALQLWTSDCPQSSFPGLLPW